LIAELYGQLLGTEADGAATTPTQPEEPELERRDMPRHLSAKLSARGAAPSTAAILRRDVGHAFKVWDRMVINIGPAAKD